MNYDGMYGAQCVDLIKYYLDEVFGLKPGRLGDAAEIFDNSDSIITNNFDKIKYYSGFIPQKGDIVIWGKDVSTRHNSGHIAIASGNGNSSVFYSYDQNWNSPKCELCEHNYYAFRGVLRPKDQTNITGGSSSGSSSSGRRFPTPVAWKNGSTTETVYKVNDLTDKIGSLSPYESALCYSKSGNSYVVLYTVNGTSTKKVGFVGYAGGVSYGPPESKEYKNGSTSETVYADTAKSMVVGSLDPYEICYGLGKINNMYLVLYKVNGTNKEKCGFVSYSGGC